MILSHNKTTERGETQRETNGIKIVCVFSSSSSPFILKENQSVRISLAFCFFLLIEHVKLGEKDSFPRLALNDVHFPRMIMVKRADQHRICIVEMKIDRQRFFIVVVVFSLLTRRDRSREQKQKEKKKRNTFPPAVLANDV